MDPIVRESVLTPRLSPTSAAAEQDVPTETINDYQVVRELGRGGFAVVKLCQIVATPASSMATPSLHPQSLVAIKIFSKSALKKKRDFVTVSGRRTVVTALDKAHKELAIMKKVRHFNVISCYEIIDDVDGDGLYLVLEFASGGQVMDWLPDEQRYVYVPTGGAMPESVARDALRGMLLGLDYLHEHQIAHRDIKPDNVLFCKTSGTYKIADLGVSHFFDDNTTDMLTKTEGTPPFFAPECCVAGGFSAKAVDVWALGVTLFAFLSGRLPFYSSNMMQLFEDIQQKPVPLELLPEGISDSAIDLLNKLLCKDPAARPKLRDVMAHDWVTSGGTQLLQHRRPITSGVIPVSDAEIETAVKPLLRFDTAIRMKMVFSKKLALQRAGSSASPREVSPNAAAGANTEPAALSSAPSTAEVTVAPAQPPLPPAAPALVAAVALAPPPQTRQSTRSSVPQNAQDIRPAEVVPASPVTLRTPLNPDASIAAPRRGCWAFLCCFSKR